MRPGSLGKHGATQRPGDVDGAAAAGVAVEGDATDLKFVGGAGWGALDGGGTAGGTNQRLLVPIRGDQNQRLRRAVLLDTPASH
jgi:hypothetical protein